MITIEEKEKIWNSVSIEFSDDEMLRDLHFIRELMEIIRRDIDKPKSIKEIGILVREEFKKWLEIHPEYVACK
ncbi:MAG: hypothetical protein HWN67_22170 [Candidatus Helarchaeota archaeon]|nr:hypothetical protein [Candidatus Helarchaeota archaeon]